MQELGTRPRSFISGNICFQFSVQCLCSADGRGGRKVVIETGSRDEQFFAVQTIKLVLYVSWPFSIMLGAFFSTTTLRKQQKRMQSKTQVKRLNKFLFVFGTFLQQPPLLGTGKIRKMKVSRAAFKKVSCHRSEPLLI